MPVNSWDPCELQLQGNGLPFEQFSASAELIHRPYSYAEVPRFRNELLLGVHHSDAGLQLAWPGKVMTEYTWWREC